jgi:hydroxyacylglutathione hydrolase
MVMIIEKIKSDIVAHLSYFLSSGSNAIVIDPQRDIQVYIDLAKKKDVNIKYIFETHRNEDYVIGSEELAEISSAEIYHGSWPDFSYGEKVSDGQVFDLEALQIKAIHTPGHTPGCTSYAVIDQETGDEPVLVFTGDALFVNEVGRTDLGGEDKRREWSANLYASIHNKLLTLGDNVIIYPAHGAGSVCGANLAHREISTIGTEKMLNPLLQMSREEFIDYKVKEIHELPPYFKMMEKLNTKGSPPLGFRPNPIPLTYSGFKDKVDEDAIIVDVRSPTDFASGFIKGSYNLFAPRLGKIGWVLPYDKSILLVINEALQIDDVAQGLARLGYDKQVGYLSGSILDWYRHGNRIEQLDAITTYELKEWYDNNDELHILDVRGEDEYISGHIEGSQNIYVGKVEREREKVPKNKPVAVMCSSGVRASFAASMLLRHEFDNISLVLGGIIAWKKAGFPMV